MLGDVDISNRQEVLDHLAGELQNEWDRIAPDLLAGPNGELDESATMQRDEVYEVCLDCYLGQNPEEWELFNLWRKDDPKFNEDLKMSAFKYETWGW